MCEGGRGIGGMWCPTQRASWPGAFRLSSHGSHGYRSEVLTVTLTSLLCVCDFWGMVPLSVRLSVTVSVCILMCVCFYAHASDSICDGVHIYITEIRVKFPVFV